MNAIKTPKLDAQAKLYKRLLETYEFYPYSYYENNKHFYYIGFYRFNKSNGMVILCDTENPTKEEIITAFKMMYNFNRIKSEALDQMIPDIKKPVSVLQEVKVMLDDIELNKDITSNKIHNDIDKLHFVIDQVVSFPDELITLFKKLQAIDLKVRDRGYLLKEDVHRAMEINFLHCKIMYNQGRAQLNGIKNAVVIIDYLKEQIDKLNDKRLVKQLINHLEIFSEARAIRDLNKSQATFEKDEFGNKIAIGPGEEGMKEYKEIYYRTVDHILDNHIKNYLRNFQ